MSYQVIARKYRPQKFDEVVGQDHVTRTLRNAIESGRIAHAYLFVGPRGTGKTTIARIFSKCLNCENGPRASFADDDPRCIEIAEGRSLDVIEIDGASNRGIEEIRDLRETVKYSPSSGKFKIYIIDEVHMLTKEAFNALLKTLEEPPAHAKFMFATTEPEKLPNTILSRCQRFDLRRIPGPLMAEHLARIAEAEEVQIEPHAIQAILRGSEGCMRDAESILDQLISFCGSNITESDALSVFGLTGEGELDALAEAILLGDRRGLLNSMHQLAQKGKDLKKAFGDLIQRLHEALTLKISGGDAGLLENTSELSIDRARKLANLVTVEGLTRALESLTQREPGMSRSSAPRVYLEISLFQALQAAHSVSLDEAFRVLRSWKTQGAPPPDFIQPVPETKHFSESAPSSVPQTQPEVNPEQHVGSKDTAPAETLAKHRDQAKLKEKKSEPPKAKLSQNKKQIPVQVEDRSIENAPAEAPARGLDPEPAKSGNAGAADKLAVSGETTQDEDDRPLREPDDLPPWEESLPGEKMTPAAAERSSDSNPDKSKSVEKNDEDPSASSDDLALGLGLNLAESSDRDDSTKSVTDANDEDKPNLAEEDRKDDLETLWSKLVEIAGPLRRASMSVGRPISLENNALTVGFYNEDAHQLEIADDQSFKRAALKKLRSEGLKDPKIRFIKINEDRPADFKPVGMDLPVSPKGSRSGKSGNGKVSGPVNEPDKSSRPKTADDAEPIQMNPEEFKNDPQIKTALELFSATLIDVKP